MSSFTYFMQSAIGKYWVFDGEGKKRTAWALTDDEV
jgi:hypothetical protein